MLTTGVEDGSVMATAAASSPLCSSFWDSQHFFTGFIKARHKVRSHMKEDRSNIVSDMNTLVISLFLMSNVFIVRSRTS